MPTWQPELTAAWVKAAMQPIWDGVFDNGLKYLLFVGPIIAVVAVTKLIVPYYVTMASKRHA